MSIIKEYYTLKRRIMVNLLAGGIGLVNVVVLSSLMKFYTDVIGMSPAMYGIVFVLFSIWNGINDPIIGFWADKQPFKTNKGKYAYLIRWAIPVMLITIIALFFASPEWNEITTAIYLLVLLVVYEAGRTLLEVSFNAFKINTFIAMQDRTEMQVIGNYVAQIPVFVGGMIPIWFLTGDFSRLTVVWIFTGTIVFGMFLNFVGSRFIKEDPEFYKHIDMTKGLKELFVLFLDLLKDKVFLYYVLGFFFINCATGNYFSGYLYYMDNVLLVSGLKATLPDVATGIFQMMIFPFIIMSVRRFGSRNTLAIGLLIAVAGHAMLSLPINYLTAAFTYVIILGGYAFSTNLLNPMQGLVVDEMEIKNGVRQPGVIAGITAVFLIPAGSVSPLILSTLLSLSGYDGAVKMQTAAVTTAIRIGTGIVPAILLALGIFLIMKFPIDAKREKEIEAIIESRHSEQRENHEKTV